MLSAPAANSRLSGPHALHPSGELLHDLVPPWLVGVSPLCDFRKRTAATDAATGARVDPADRDAWGLCHGLSWREVLRRNLAHMRIHRNISAQSFSNCLMASVIRTGPGK